MSRKKCAKCIRSGALAARWERTQSLDRLKVFLIIDDFCLRVMCVIPSVPPEAHQHEIQPHQTSSRASHKSAALVLRSAPLMVATFAFRLAGVADDGSRSRSFSSSQ